MTINKLEKVRGIIRDLDTNTFEQRVNRQSRIPKTTFYGNIPSRVFHLLSEADSCFRNGEYNGCIAVLTTAIEYSLQMFTNSKSGLNKLIGLAKEQGIIDQNQ